MNKTFILYIILIIILDAGASILAKLWSIHKHPLLLLGTFLTFGIAGYFFARSLQYEGVAVTNIIWIALSIIMVTLIGYFGFKEPISLLQVVGIITIIIGLVLINLK